MPDNRTKKNRPETISKDKVQELRQLTGEGFMACAKALHVCDGDIVKATQWLKEAGSLRF